MKAFLLRTLRRIRWPLLAIALLLGWAAWGPMDPLFDTPRSTVLLDRDGNLLGATVATDGQWRMPRGNAIPVSFEQCLLEFEDRHFRDHWGIHVPSIIRAMQQNFRAGRTVSGGSTITMQVARMAKHGPRSYFNKFMEILTAIRIEMRFSKDEILQLYADNAPFGANVVGIEAAAWRWFGRAPENLSWSENAVLAVLPNAPSQIHPGRGRTALRAKRDRLLSRLLANGSLDSMQWSLSIAEPLPEEPIALPRKAEHLLATLSANGHRGERIKSTVKLGLQDRIASIAQRSAYALRANEVHNAAVLVLDVNTGEVLAYIGNLPGTGLDHAGAVDIIQARRSTGSLLKPFLYADMLQSGELMPAQLVADLPTQYNGFAPRNYDDRYDGAVPASQALARSLNVPAVRALRSHGIDRTLRMFRSMGLHHIDRSADNYGLSLIIGGAESTLWELTGAYASMARTLNSFSGDAKTGSALVHPPIAILEAEKKGTNDGPPPLSAAAIHHTIKALQELNRPELESGWKHFSGSERIAWKTGTSFGHRDAWAIGITDLYAVGVWTGNASGEGRPGLTGSLAAAPIMFEVFGILPTGNGFDIPFEEMEKMNVCRKSGYRTSPECGRTDTVWTLTAAGRTPLCPYHQRILLDPSGTLRARPGPNAHAASWFVLPPAMEHYYTTTHTDYRPLPPWEAGTDKSDANTIMQMIYPENGAELFVPVQLKGDPGKIVLLAAHRDPAARIFWDLDGTHLGSTINNHELTISVTNGPHTLTLTDQQGKSLNTRFNCRVNNSLSQ